MLNFLFYTFFFCSRQFQILFPFFSVYVQKLRLCALCCYGNRRERETVYVFQKLSAYMLWILITKPTHEPSLLSTPNTITFFFHIYVCCQGKLRTYLFSFAAIHFILNLMSRGQREALVRQLEKYKTVLNKCLLNQNEDRVRRHHNSIYCQNKKKRLKLY